MIGQNCIRLKRTCKGYRNNPRGFGLRPALHPKSTLRALSSDREDVKRDDENTSINGLPPYSRSPKLIQGPLQTSTLRITCSVDLCKAFGKPEKLPRLPELDAPGSLTSAAGYSRFSPTADGPPQDVLQTNLIALPPLLPCNCCYSKHSLGVSASLIAQFPPLGPNRPRPIEPLVLVPTYISKRKLSHKFPGSLRDGI